MNAAARALAPRYSRADELSSMIMHAVGIVLSIGGLATLVAFAALTGQVRAVLASAVFGTSLILLYTASTIYHAVAHETARRILRTVDHIAIFLLIAGTYTPFALLVLPGATGWWLFSAIWALALAGSAMELGVFRNRHGRLLASLLYVAMGWLGVLVFGPLRDHLELGGMLLLFGGGAAYTLGVPFYLWRQLPFHHTIWHGFVLAGSVLHYLAVLLYVLPDRVV